MTITSQTYIDRLKVQPSECSCKKCQRMCHAPCCGSVEDFEKIIEAGYANRLMFDDLPSTPAAGPFLKPALKGSEGKQAPWATSSEEGCTFWKEGKCELHSLDLKPIQGRLAIHNGNGKTTGEEYSSISNEDWESQRGKDLIEKWKRLVGYNE